MPVMDRWGFALGLYIDTGADWETWALSIGYAAKCVWLVVRFDRRGLQDERNYVLCTLASEASPGCFHGINHMLFITLFYKD